MRWGGGTYLRQDSGQLEILLRNKVSGHPSGENNELWESVTGLLREGPASPALRRALWQVAANMSDVELVGAAGGRFRGATKTGPERVPQQPRPGPPPRRARTTAYAEHLQPRAAARQPGMISKGNTRSARLAPAVRAPLDSVRAAFVYVRSGETAPPTVLDAEGLRALVRGVPVTLGPA